MFCLNFFFFNEVPQKKIGCCLWRRYPRDVTVLARFVTCYTWHFFVFRKVPARGIKIFFLFLLAKKLQKCWKEREKYKKVREELAAIPTCLEIQCFSNERFFFYCFWFYFFWTPPKTKTKKIWGPPKKVFFRDPTQKSLFGDPPTMGCHPMLTKNAKFVTNALWG